MYKQRPHPPTHTALAEKQGPNGEVLEENDEEKDQSFRKRWRRCRPSRRSRGHGSSMLDSETLAAKENYRRIMRRIVL